MNKKHEVQARERAILAACGSVRALANWIERHGLDNRLFVLELERAMLSLQRCLIELRAERGG